MYKYINSNIQNIKFKMCNMLNKLNDDVMIKIFEYKHNLEYKKIMDEIKIYLNCVVCGFRCDIYTYEKNICYCDNCQDEFLYNQIEFIEGDEEY